MIPSLALEQKKGIMMLTCRRKWRGYKYNSFFSWGGSGRISAGRAFLLAASMEPISISRVLCFLHGLHLDFDVLMPNLSHEEFHEEEEGDEDEVEIAPHF